MARARSVEPTCALSSAEEAQKLAASIEVTTTVNIASLETDVAQRRLVLKLNKSNLKQKNMSAAEVKDKLERATRLFVQADKEKNPSKLLLILKQNIRLKTLIRGLFWHHENITLLMGSTIRE